ncbi:MAG: hypothetical protein NT045_01110 [Candidatus Aureabacteria bacterium]|nr:hypothetical protein [Candidatus Auribacterota bacterium]
MSKARTVYATCPLCGAMLEVNIENGRVVRHFEAKEKGSADELLSEGLKAVREGAAAREEKFKTAREHEKGKIDRIDGLFKEKKKEVEDSGDTSRPIRQIDLD